MASSTRQGSWRRSICFSSKKVMDLGPIALLESPPNLKGMRIEEPPILFKDFVGAGMDSAAELIKLPFYQTHMSGILLHGPPGCDTTNLARALAYEFRVPFYQYPGQDTILQFFFFKAYQTAPSIVFIDEIDAIDDVNQLLMCIDDSRRLGSLLVIGATNKPDAIDPALMSPRRFDHEIALGCPADNSRVHILSALTRKMENLTI